MDRRIIKREKMKNFKYQITFVLLFVLQLAQAQPVFESDNVQDATPAPIDNYVLLALLLGIYFAYRFLKQKNKIII